LRAAVCESDWIVGASTTSAAASRGDGRRRLGGVRLALGDHRQSRVGAVALRLDHASAPDLFGHGVADDEHLFAGWTPMHCLTTVLTALSRSAPLTRSPSSQGRRRDGGAATIP